MTLTILNSGSTGNGYVLQSDTEALVLECGVPRQDCLAALGWQTKKVAGCLVTHEHGDHAHYIEDYLQLMPVYCSKGTAEALCYKRSRRPQVLAPLRTVQIGGFRVRPIPAEHDAAEPFAYIIDHEDLGRLLFATDTYYLRYRIPDMTNLLIECNYSLPLLNANVEAGLIPAALKNRTLDSHMSLEHLKDMLAANDLRKVAQIVLIHLSARNSDPQAFCREIIRHTGKPTTYATKGLTLELNTTPF
ncbi:MAG: MBL fold metallo-hydrolase [Paludibacteraceae bacterium]|nr:MBL fold metallo-hydrolase [Paludibacteraceae bacterium]